MRNLLRTAAVSALTAPLLLLGTGAASANDCDRDRCERHYDRDWCDELLDLELDLDLDL